MISDPLPVAVIGLGGFGRLTLQALRQLDVVNVVGVADNNTALAEQAGKELDVAAYGDNRSLLAEARPKAVYLAVPSMAAPEIISACADRGIHVWKELPLARNLDEAVAIVQRMEEASLKLAVGTQRRFAVGYRRAWELCPRLGEVFLGRAHYLFNWGPKLAWRGDKASAGGGALLELGYHAIDLLTWLLGLPERVYGLTALGNRPESQNGADEPLPIYDTDDTAAAILHYAGGAMATVVTTRSSGPVSEELSLHGRGGSLTATSEFCLLRDPDGNVLDHAEDSSPPLELFKRQVEAFALSVLNDSPACECSGWENLLNMAVVEAIYLADRTAQPESPRHLLQTRGLAPEECLPRKKPDHPAEEQPSPPTAAN